MKKEFRFLLCVFDIYSKHAWVISLKDKKGVTINNTFWKFLDESNRNEIKYRQRKAVNFKIDQWNHG